MEFAIDRALPIPIRQQLKGLIEYGIACGDVMPGEALPSVRDLALAVGVAPMTVSQVYADLKAQGLVETRAGSGTFVAEYGAAQRHAQHDVAALHHRIDALIDEGLALGLRSSDLASLIHARLAARARHGRRKSIAIVGLFPGATARYARLIAQQIGNGATVAPATLDLIQRDPAIRASVASVDLVVTFVNRQREVASLLPGARVISIRFTPAEETQRALAGLPAGTKLLLVARLPEFLPIMAAGVARFAPQAGPVRSSSGGPDDIAELAGQADIVVFASGTEYGLVGIPQTLPVIEYTHIPDAADVRRRIMPLLDETGSSADA